MKTTSRIGKMSDALIVAMMLTALAAPPPSANGAYLQNGGFEVPVLADGQSVSTIGVHGWVSQWSVASSGAWNMDNTSPNGGAINPDTAYSYNGVAFEGQNIGYISTDVGLDVGLYQSTSVPHEPGKIYDLSAGIGNPYPENLPAGGNAPDYRLELLVYDPQSQGLTLVGVAGGAGPDPGSWTTDTASYTAPPSAVSGIMSVRLVAEGSTEQNTLNFDDVQLLVDGQIPEPAVPALLGLGLAPLLALRCRRK